MKDGRIKLLPEFFLCFSLFMLLIPIKWILSWMAAAVLHEIFHILALKLCGYEIRCITIGALGAKIETNAEYGVKSMLCALAGPIAGFVLLLFARKIPMIALCGLFQSAANLLPVYPLDGGRAVRNLLYWFLPVERVTKITVALEKAVWILLLSFSTYGFIRLHLGLLPLFAVCMLFLRKKYLAIKGICEYNSGIVYL